MRWFLIALALCYVQAASKGCAAYCNNAKCKQQCENSVNRNFTQYNADARIGTKFIGSVDTTMEITGSDSIGKRSSRYSYFTTRDGKIFYVTPNIQDEVSMSIQPELRLVWEMPKTLRLDTSNNKGLYSIAFSKDKNGIIPAYILYAAQRDQNDKFDHYLRIATLEFNVLTKTFSFVKVLFSLEQKSNFRSGGFLTVGRTDYSMNRIPLWFSSGGNDYDDPLLMHQVPRYSAISLVWTEEKVPNPGLADLFVPGDINSILWANGISNPLQCDYSIQRSTQMPCLVESRGIDGEVDARIIAIYEKGHTPTESTAEVFYTRGTTGIMKAHAERFVYTTEECMPESIYYNTAMGMGAEFMNRIITARPSCDIENFPPMEISYMKRNYDTGELEFLSIRIAMSEPFLYDVELIGSELNRGIYIGGRNLRSGDYELFLLYDRTEEIKLAQRKHKKV